MSTDVHELYQHAIRPMSEQDRLELIALIISDLKQPRITNGELPHSGKNLSDLFSSVSLGYPTGIDNEKIDADLAHEYGSTHEDED
jgi:hypothetical protein